MALSLNLNERWTTSLEKEENHFTPSKGVSLEQVVEDTNSGKNVNVDYGGVFSDNRLVINKLGFIGTRNRGMPLVLATDGNWYTLQTSKKSEPGNFYVGSIEDKITGFLKPFRRLDKEEVSVSNKKDAVYKSDKSDTLATILNLKKGEKPVYEGNILYFTRGHLWWKEQNPILTKEVNDAKEKIQISGSLVISPEDYTALVNYFKEKGYKIIAPKDFSIKPVEDLDTKNQPDKKQPDQQPPMIRRHKSPTTLTPELKEHFDSHWAGNYHLEDFRKIEGINNLLKSVRDDYKFTTEYLQTTITKLEKICVDPKYWRGDVWVAQTTTPGEVFVVVDHPRSGVIYEHGWEIGENGKKVAVKYTPPRAIKNDLVIWPEDAVTLEEIPVSEYWRTGAVTITYIDGYVAIPKGKMVLNKGEYKGSKIRGILGMSDHEWRKMLVDQSAKQIFESLKESLGSNGLNYKGVEDEPLLEKAIDYYNSNPILGRVSGGETSFAKSVLNQLKNRYEILNRQELGKNKL